MPDSCASFNRRSVTRFGVFSCVIRHTSNPPFVVFVGQDESVRQKVILPSGVFESVYFEQNVTFDIVHLYIFA